VTSSAQGAAGTVAGAAKKARPALLAGGAAAAGIVATVAVARARRRPKVLGVSLPKRRGVRRDTRALAGTVSDAADRADHLGQSVSKIATSVKQVSENADKVAKKA
jgi:hypothetical protein